MEKDNYDIEQHAYSSEKHRDHVNESGAVPAETFITGDSLYAKLQRKVNHYGVETRGIERVPEDERTDTTVTKVATMWLAANMVVSSFAIGALAVPVYYLGFVDSFLVILFINILGILPVAFFSTFGAKFGLRQMIMSRFFFGYYGVKMIAIFNALACLGWSASNVIVGAQIIHTVNSDVPPFAGIIIIGFCTFLVTLFGYKVVHMYEFWSWIPSFIMFLILLGTFAHSGDFYNIPMVVGTSSAGDLLSFAGSVFGFATGWATYAADYTVYQPANTSPVKIFIGVFCGLLFPLCFTEWLGLAIATATVNNATYLDAYTENSVGGLLGVVLFKLGGFGKFCMIILALSIIANNCPNIYSLGFSLQVLARWTQKVPRFIWTLIGTIIFVVVAIPAYDHFALALEYFMLIIAYYLAIYEGIALPEHFFFRGGMGGYVVEQYDQPHLLPKGYAALGAFLMGVLGTAMGMAQVWYVSPIGSLIGELPYGGDIGFELAFGFTFVTYCVLRPLEKKYIGR